MKSMQVFILTLPKNILYKTPRNKPYYFETPAHNAQPAKKKGNNNSSSVLIGKSFSSLGNDYSYTHIPSFIHSFIHSFVKVLIHIVSSNLIHRIFLIIHVRIVHAIAILVV